jgi:hypothetical protein
MPYPDKPTYICLTPIRNEAWILERFLQCASLWADHIIVADQCSDDGSREIARRFSKVTLIDNDSPAYDEGARQRLLIEASRAIPAEGKRVLIALDADEMLTANWKGSAEWEKAASAKEGTVLRFQWVNLQPGFDTAWIPREDIAFGYVDDGSPHTGEKIHSTRLPTPAGAPVLPLRDIKVLHYQYTSWERMRSKQRWYQCWERLNHPAKRPIQIYRQYNFMQAFPPDEMHPTRPEWLDGYESAGIDMRGVRSEGCTWWDREIVSMFLKHGTERFRRLDIWDVDWPAVAASAGVEVTRPDVADPRSAFDKRVHRWLRATQPRSKEPRIRLLQRALRTAGW